MDSSIYRKLTERQVPPIMRLFKSSPKYNLYGGIGYSPPPIESGSLANLAIGSIPLLMALGGYLLKKKLDKKN